MNSEYIQERKNKTELSKEHIFLLQMYQVQLQREWKQINYRLGKSNLMNILK